MGSEIATQLDGPGYCVSGCSELIMSSVSRLAGGGGYTFGVLLVFSASPLNKFREPVAVRLPELPLLPPATFYYSWRLDDPSCAVGNDAAKCLQPFGDQHPVMVTDAHSTDSAIFVVSPVMACGWVLLGEVSKFIPVSADRIVGVMRAAAGGLALSLQGATGESITLLAAQTSSKIREWSGVAGPDGSATIVLPCSE